MKYPVIILVVFIFGCSSDRINYQKYDISSGVLTYEVDFPFQKHPIKQRVYFSDYGATEYFEFVNKEEFPTLPILKKDSLEYVFVSDSIAIKNPRTFMHIFEKLTKKSDSYLSNDDLVILSSSDTIVDQRKCVKIDFKIPSTGQTGKAALYKGIPIWVDSTWQEGVHENLKLIDLNTDSTIPIKKTKLMEYVNV